MNAFDGLISSKVRVKLLVRLFLNPLLQAYVRELAQDFQVSPSQIKSELDHLKSSGLLNSTRSGRQIYYRANDHHPLFPELHSMVRKSLGMDRIVDSILERLGNLEAAYLVGDYAEGRDSGIIDIVLIGEVDPHNLADLTQKTEQHIGRRIRVIVLTQEEFDRLVGGGALTPRLPLWQEGT